MCFYVPMSRSSCELAPMTAPIVMRELTRPDCPVSGLLQRCFGYAWNSIGSSGANDREPVAIPPLREPRERGKFLVVHKIRLKRCWAAV
jgi:hypothetical protein